MLKLSEIAEEMEAIIPDNTQECIEVLMRHRLHLLKHDYLEAMQERANGIGKPKRYPPLIPFHQWADGWATLALAVEINTVFPRRIKADAATKRAMCNKAITAIGGILTDLKVTVDFKPVDDRRPNGDFTIRLYAQPR